MSNKTLGCAIDVGTMNFLSARQEEEGAVAIKRMRNAFLDLDASHKRFLQLSDVNYIEKDGKVLIVGDEAMDVANMFQREARRPMQRGLISSREMDSAEVLSLMIEQLLGTPQVKDEVCYFSVPAAPVDDPSQDIIFHEGVFRRMIGEHGYDAQPMNEAAAICFSEAESDGFSALTFSFGSGMTNCALTYRTLTTMSFSVARGGDWIDEKVAQACNITASKAVSIKEKEADLIDFASGNPRTLRAREAIGVYYRNLIGYALDHVESQLLKVQTEIPMAIPIIIGGGTSLARNFLPFFKEEFAKRKNFPIEISEIRHASNPMNAVAKGLLVNARLSY
tara:strand:+ start:8663 stop:9670 length:1008 start_codon:yes stop_codon:yes gene_type:complete